MSMNTALFLGRPAALSLVTVALGLVGLAVTSVAITLAVVASPRFAEALCAAAGSFLSPLNDLSPAAGDAVSGKTRPPTQAFSSASQLPIANRLRRANGPRSEPSPARIISIGGWHTQAARSVKG